MTKTLSFSLDSIEEVSKNQLSCYERKKQDRFIKVKIRAFGDGENAHTQPIDTQTLMNCADSVYDIPLICELNPFRNNADFGTHGILTGHEFSFGFVKESKDNPVVFEKDEKTGKTFITIFAIIWKKYFNNIIEILESKDNKTEVSVEMEMLSDSPEYEEKPSVKQFVLTAITFLGNVTRAACKGAEATLCFSDEDKDLFDKEKQEYLASFEDGIIIDNSKEAAVDGKWANPKQKLLNPITKASNETKLLNEAYLIVDDKGEDELTLADVKYPHHIIKDGKLVLHIRGVEAAFARASQQGVVEGEIKDHLLRHYKELGLTQENFAEFGLTQQKFTQYFSEYYRKEDTNLTCEQKKALIQTGLTSALKVEGKADFWVRDYDDKKVYYFDYTDQVLYAVDYTITEDLEVTIDLSAKEACVVDFKSLKEAEKEFIIAFAKENDIDLIFANLDDKPEDKPDDNEGKPEGKPEDKPEGKPEGKPDEKAEEDDKKATFEELEAKCCKLEAENKAFMEQIEAMSDYNELKQFAEEAKENQKKEQEMAEMNKVMGALEDKGVKMTEEETKELCDKIVDFENITAWSNYVKAFALDKLSINTDGIIIMQTPNQTPHKQTNSQNIWDELSKSK